MSPAPTALESRIAAISAALPKAADRLAINEELTKARGDLADAVPSLEKVLSAPSLKRVALAHSLAEWSSDNPAVVKAFAKQRDVASMRDVALRYDTKKIAGSIDPKSVPSDTPGKTADQKLHGYAADLHNKLFHAHTSAVLQRMVRDKEVPVVHPAVRSGIVRFLDKNPDFNIRTTSVYDALKKPDALKGVQIKHRPAVIEHLKTLQRVQAMSPTSEAVPKLMKAKLTSAFHVSEMGESTFLATHSKSLGEDTARQVYTNAIDTRIRNEQALMSLHDAVRGTGIGVLDGRTTPGQRVAKTQATLQQHGAPLDLNALFGGADYCECDECSSVYSPAAYFVELLNYLRNNNLKPAAGQPPAVHGYAGTALQQLFRRRPDLGCIELTCENTYTVLPYVDLANEVMESFVVHLDTYAADPNVPKQATLEAFNVIDEPSSELLAQPQHINYQAYCKLKNAPYPLSLPYHQPIDAARILLDYMGTSREELLRRFRTDQEDTSALGLSAADDQSVQQLHREAQSRAIDAEALAITQEDYIILTREAFWQKQYFVLTQQHAINDATYRTNIGVRPVYEYFGYKTQAAMLDVNPVKRTGLTFVKRFLSVTGVQYTDLVALLQTQSINPLYPQGRALTVMESLRMSYRAMQALVVTSSNDPKVRFGNLIKTLQTSQERWAKLDAMLHPDPCHQHVPTREGLISSRELQQWVECWFERVGQLIVIETGDGPQLSLTGDVYGTGRKSDRVPVIGGMPLATLRSDGTIVDPKGRVIGHVNFDGTVVTEDGKLLPAFLKQTSLVVVDPATRQVVATITGRRLTTRGGSEKAEWWPAQDSCDLSKARIVHLDGSPVTVDEYDNLQRFVRLWRRLGWIIDEVDKALVGYSAPSANGPLDTNPPATSNTSVPPSAALLQPGVDFDAFGDDCSAFATNPQSAPGGNNRPVCPAPALATFQITPAFLHQLAAIKKMNSRYGQTLIALLSFWSDISTAGTGSLYASLFLKHNVTALDPVFKSDVNGNFLAVPAKISEHVPAIMAALGLKSDDLAAIVAMRQMNDVLDLHNLSVLYRHSLLARILGIKPAQLPRVLAVFGEPFADATTTWQFCRLWGRMTDAGFNYRQLDFVSNSYDDPKQPLGPSFIKTLQLSKTLHDGLRQIDVDQHDLDPARPDLATDELVRSKAALLYDARTVDRIVALLDGKTVYTTNAPVLAKVPLIPPSLDAKLQYAKSTPPGSATILVTGILTADEQLNAANASTKAAWKLAVQRIVDQAQAGGIFDDVLSPVFPNLAAAKAKLLVGDVSVPAAQIDPNLPDPNTAPTKRIYFLGAFMPFLRQRLARQLIVTTMASAVGVDNDVAETLLTNALVIGPPSTSAMDVLLALKDPVTPAPGMWKGYLIAPASDAFVLSVTSDLEPPAWQAPPAPPVPNATRLDSVPLDFPNQGNDPSNVWSSPPVQLERGRAYALEIDASLLGSLSWKRAASAVESVPAAYLLADDSTQAATGVFVSMRKAAIIASGFTLDAAEIAFFQGNPADFDGFDLNTFTLAHWKRLRAYTGLRDSLPKTDLRLIDLFKWCSPASVAALAPPQDPVAMLPGKIAAATRWDVERIAKLIATPHFNVVKPAGFVNEVNLCRLQRALAIADKTRMDVDRLFEWANPTSQFAACHNVAEAIRKALQARFKPTDWEQVVKPLNDKLRGHQQQALTAYLLSQEPLIEWGAVDADSLFEFFLIDVQMCTCMETSRIKQAIASVQQYVQRCMLGLEEPYVHAEVLDRGRWQWMQKYRVWEANRKVFLYPENWLKSSLRDDKSPFYKELESELLQKDIDPDLIVSALRRFLYKVDEVANMQVVAIHVAGNVTSGTLHVFARTRATPHALYYRTYSFASADWTPWEKMQVDIPAYELTDAHGVVAKTGVYLVPVVWNNRLLILFPEFLKKSAPNAQAQDKKFSDINDSKVSDTTQQNVYWEIKLAWSERRDGKWTQKQVSGDRAFHYWSTTFAPPDYLPAGTVLKQGSPLFLQLAAKSTDPSTYFMTDITSISQFVFVPRADSTSVASPPKDLNVDIYYCEAGSSLPGSVLPRVARFTFSGNELHVDPADPPAQVSSGEIGLVMFQLIDTGATQTAYSLQAAPSGDPPYFGAAPAFKASPGTALMNLSGSPATFSYGFTHDLLKAANTEDLDGLYLTFRRATGNTLAHLQEAFGATGTGPTQSYSELKRPYSLYNWEFGFHAPMAMVEKMASAKQFDAALNVFHYVFDPGSADTDPQRCWVFPPFKKVNPEASLEQMFLALKPGVANADITAWRDDPFEPHLVARGRPVAYMKWAVMKYIRLLVDYGDYYFRQNTLETVPLAIQCYVLASHLFGPRPQVIPKRGKVQPQTYQSLLDKWDAFGNAIVELELIFPFSNQTTQPLVMSNGVVGLPNIFGFATSLYFGIPPNADLLALRALIDDRLYKIRHCEDINGVFRRLALFEPEIDPALLVEAEAQGLSLDSVLDDLASPTPNYRFNYLLQKAYAFASETKALGAAFLAATEKGDAEALARLRAEHETTIATMVLDVRNQQLAEANAALDGLEQSRKGPVNRLRHYLQLIGADLSSVPGKDADFNELADPIEAPTDESGLILSGYEKEEMATAAAAAMAHDAVGRLESLAGILGLIPEFGLNVQLFGIGPTVDFGGRELSAFTQATARMAQVIADELSYESSNAGRKAGYLRQLQDRVLQANAAGLEIKNIDKQILTQKIRIDIATKEIANQQKQADNAQAVEDFLRNKYSSQELYGWMQDSLRALYYQSYALAFDMASRTQAVFRFERPLSPPFITQGYWNDARDGLLAGEHLDVALKRMELAYVADRPHDSEVSRPAFSLREIDPLALIQLRASGTCEFELTEALFDKDFPGDYMRRIKTVALDVPCVVGPGVSLSCRLVLLEHRYRKSASLAGGYAEQQGDSERRFDTANVPVTAIAVSSGQNEHGVFELAFNGERYLPFEGAGVISRWRIELQRDFRPFDYETISDVGIRVQYTSCVGGESFKSAANAQLGKYLADTDGTWGDREGSFAAFELSRDFPDEWYRSITAPVAGATTTFSINSLIDRLPYQARFKTGKARASGSIVATDMYFACESSLTPNCANVLFAGDTILSSFTLPDSTGLDVTVLSGNYAADKWSFAFDFTAPAAADRPQHAWLVIRYTLS